MQRMSLIFVFLLLSTPLNGCYSQEDPYTWDFGQVRQGEILKHTFIFKNETSKIMNIKDIHTSCGCTASKAQKKKLMPQEEASIEVSFDTKGYSGPTKQFIYINTDDLDNPVIRYIIKVEVVN